MDPQTEVKPAEHCPASEEKKKKPKLGFAFWFGVVKFLASMATLADKYVPKILKFFDDHLN